MSCRKNVYHFSSCNGSICMTFENIVLYVMHSYVCKIDAQRVHCDPFEHKEINTIYADCSRVLHAPFAICLLKFH